MVFCPILALTTAAFGQETKLKSPVSELDVVFDSPVSDTVRMLVLHRITLSTEALVNYYHQYPVEKVEIRVPPHFRRGASGGQASG